MRLRGTHTVAMLSLSAAAYEEISRKLKDARYDHVFMPKETPEDKPAIDMSGIGIVPEPQGDMVTVPVLLGFDSSKVVGMLSVHKDKMPPGANWVLSLGYRLLKYEMRPTVEGQKLRGIDAQEIELVCVSLATDTQYKKYLESDVYKADYPT